MIRKTLIFLSVCCLVMSVPTDEEVKYPIPGYNEHKWYSGNKQIT